MSGRPRGDSDVYGISRITAVQSCWQNAAIIRKKDFTLLIFPEIESRRPQCRPRKHLSTAESQVQPAVDQE